MRIIFIITLIIFSKISFAKDTPSPSLGNCSEYSDYYIYKCKPFKCKLPVAILIKTTLEMEVIGNEGESCLYKYKYIIRNPKIPPSEIKMTCSLSQRGKLEMSNQFTNYKKGNVNVYVNPPVNEILNKECSRY